MWVLKFITYNGINKNSNDMEDKIFNIVTDLIREDIGKEEAIHKLLVLYNVINCRCKEPVKCINCDEMVVMVSEGEFCPSCYC